MNFPLMLNNDWLSLFLVVVGPFMGSFISASALAWPSGINFRISRSRCTHCDRLLGVVDLVPLVSFLVLKGKCRTCHNPIERQHIIAEVTSTLIALASVFIFDGWVMLASALFGAVLLYIALVDFRTRLIPDIASFTLIASGPAVLYLVYAKDGLSTALIGAVVGYGIFWLVAFAYRHIRGREGLGMGDAKLLAGGGAWLGPLALPWIILLASTGALVILLLTGNGNLRKDTELPFGPALAVAIYALWLWSGSRGTGLVLL